MENVIFLWWQDPTFIEGYDRYMLEVEKAIFKGHSNYVPSLKPLGIWVIGIQGSRVAKER